MGRLGRSRLAERARPAAFLVLGALLIARIGLDAWAEGWIADLQVRVLWEELLQRYERVEVVGPPVRTRSSFVNGYTELPVQLHAK